MLAGVRVNAFISGGAVPASVRGQKREGLIAIADMHATICSLAGVAIEDPMPFAGVPGVDGIDMSSYVLSPHPPSSSSSPSSPRLLASPRTEVMLSCLGNTTVIPGSTAQQQLVDVWTGGALIVGNHKLIYGTQLGTVNV